MRLLRLSLLFFFLSFLQPLWGQLDLIVDSKFASLEDAGSGIDYFGIDLLFENDRSLFIYQKELGDKDFVIVVNKETMQREKLIEDPMELPGRHKYYPAKGNLGGRYFMGYYDYTDQSNPEVVLQFMDEEWWEGEDKHVLYRFNIPEGSEHLVHIIPDPNGKYLALLEAKEYANGLCKERIILFDSELKPVLTKDYPSSNAFELQHHSQKGGTLNTWRYVFKSAKFDDQGNLYYILPNNVIAVHRVDQGYDRFVYFMPDLYGGLDYYFRNQRLSVLGGKVFFTTDLYKDITEPKDTANWKRHYEQLLGCYSMLVSSEDFDIIQRQFTLFNKEQLPAPRNENNRFYNVNYSKFGRKYSECILLEDGSIIRVSERVGNDSFIWYAGNISITKFSPDGEFEWVRYLNKNQSMGIGENVYLRNAINEVRAPYSYQISQQGNYLYFLYNMRNEADRTNLKFTKELEKTNLHVVELDTRNGEMKTKQFEALGFDGFCMLPFGANPSRINNDFLLLSKPKFKEIRLNRFQVKTQ